MKILTSHVKMFALPVGCYGHVALGKAMTCSDQHVGKTGCRTERAALGSQAARPVQKLLEKYSHEKVGPEEEAVGMRTRGQKQRRKLCT